MKTSNPSQSEKLKNKRHEQDVNENANKMGNMNQSNSNKNMPGSSGNSNYKSNKGTGMSSEAGANQTEESWQGTGGSNPTSMQNDMNNINKSRGSGNMSNVGTSRESMGSTTDKGIDGNQDSDNLNTDKIKNQSNQQRRSSMGDGTPEMREKNMKNTKLPDEEMNGVDWGSSKK
jgi:translation initiation factor IF-2